MTLECSTDLPERQRRARFSSSEQRSLAAHYAVCAACRSAQQIMTDFAELDTVDPRDGARIQGLAALARSRVSGFTSAPAVRARKRLQARALVLAAALLLLVGSALASARRWHEKADPKSVRPVVLGTSHSPIDARPTAPAAPPVIETAAPAVTSAASIAATARIAVPMPNSAVDSASAHAPESVSAASLLRQAGAAARRGDRDTAASLYQQLQGAYPASAEAMLSHVSLGRLLAERGQPRAAVTEFDRYLSAAPGGVLLPEALYGRARALTGLGDRAEELRTWQRLQRDFPDSAYAARARSRVAELE